MLGLRRVDARSGGPVTIGGAVAGAMLDFARQAGTKPLLRSRVRREHERLSALQPQMKEIGHKYAADPEARERALMQFYKTNRVNPLRGCALPLLHGLLAQLSSALWSRQGQTIRDRVTGTIVVLDS